jgi:hypothetical protein
VPRADEATVLVDLAVREIGAQMPAAPRDGIALTVDVEYRPSSDAPDRSGSKLVNGSYSASIDEAPEARCLRYDGLER